MLLQLITKGWMHIIKLVRVYIIWCTIPHNGEVRSQRGLALPGKHGLKGEEGTSLAKHKDIVSPPLPHRKTKKRNEKWGKFLKTQAARQNDVNNANAGK